MLGGATVHPTHPTNSPDTYHSQHWSDSFKYCLWIIVVRLSLLLYISNYRVFLSFQNGIISGHIQLTQNRLTYIFFWCDRQSSKQLSTDLIDRPCVWVIWLERPAAQSEARKRWSNSSAWFCNTDSFSLPSRMCWSSQSRNTPTITCSSCVSSASVSLSLITPCCFSAMKNCLFRNGKSSKSKVVTVQHLTKVSEKRVQTSHWVAGKGWREVARKVKRGQLGWPQEGDTYGPVKVTLEEKHLGSVVPIMSLPLTFQVQNYNLKVWI